MVVIGAGPAGLMAAIQAARLGAYVMVLEKNDKPLKKLYATGNGRCNFSNLNMDDKVYRGNNSDFAMKIVDYYDRNDLLLFFHELGMMTKHIGDYIYPYNEQARSVASVLLLECRRLGIDIICNEPAIDIITRDVGFTVNAYEHKYHCLKVIVAPGGKASPVHGSDGNFNNVLLSLGHHMISQQPALVPLGFVDSKLAELAGVRVKCGVKLEVEGNIISSEKGEIIFNKDNISGIPIMQMSRYATTELVYNKSVAVHINMFPDISVEELAGFINTTFGGEFGIFDETISGEEHINAKNTPLGRERNALEALSLCLNEKLARICLERASIIPKSLAGNVSTQQLNKLADVLSDFVVDIDKDAGFERAQVTAGGIPVDEITDNMESRKVPGLYIIGEICDVDGTCGGYNLQWAFSGGAVSGRAAVESIRSTYL